MMENSANKVCLKGLWNETVPGIFFNDEGVSNYARIQESLMRDYPKGEKGEKDWENLVNNIKGSGKGKQYDCLIGVSGGTDSCYLLHVAKENGLRPLAVNMDNGWNSDIAVQNIKKMTSALDIDLETYVIEYEEMKDILRTYMRASLPWIDGPTDQAIGATLYRTANREGIKYILTGTDFRSEGKQPSEWTHIDSKQLKYLHKKFGEGKLKSYPVDTFYRTLYYRFVKKINKAFPFNYIPYNKKEAQKFLIEEYGWEYYGGHHHENLFTKWVIGYWLTQKFNIDKRIITLSAQILSGEISREEAVEHMKQPSYPLDRIEEDTQYILKKLDLTEEDFDKIWESENKYFMDYPSYFPAFEKYSKFLIPIASKLTSTKPKTFYEIEMRNDNN
jgi:N-acetyl sugar amidotransferase